MSVASDESALIARKKDAADLMYAYLDALWSAGVLGELPSNVDLLAVEDLLEGIDGRG